VPVDNSNETERLLLTPVVKALTVTPSVLGVPYMYFVFIGMASAIVFLIFRNLLWLSVCLPIYAAGRVMIMRDPKIFEIMSIYYVRCQSRFVGFWRAKSYKV
jgi:type IV secretion system protein VirB3